MRIKILGYRIYGVAQATEKSKDNSAISHELL